MDKKRSVSASEKQKNMLVEHLKKNTQLLSGKFSANFTTKDAELKWKELANILNSIPGSQKDWKSWRKTWQDMRSRTKAKCGKNFRERVATGGGPYQEEPLTKTEEDIANIIKVVSVEGHSSVQESVITNIQNENMDEIVLTINENIDHQNQTPLINKAFEFPRNINKKDTSLQHTAKAAEDFRSFVTQTEEKKNAYYQEKLKLLERIALAKERSANSKGRIAESLEKIAVLMERNS